MERKSSIRGNCQSASLPNEGAASALRHPHVRPGHSDICHTLPGQACILGSSVRSLAARCACGADSGGGVDIRGRRGSDASGCLEGDVARGLGTPPCVGKGGGKAVREGGWVGGWVTHMVSGTMQSQQSAFMFSLISCSPSLAHSSKRGR